LEERDTDKGASNSWALRTSPVRGGRRMTMHPPCSPAAVYENKDLDPGYGAVVRKPERAVAVCF